jgi:SAM-dependent methyltransferase
LSERAALAIGIDLSAGMIAGAVRNNLTNESRVAVADIEMLPLTSSVVDVVVAAFMLYHVPNLSSGLSEVRRVLRPDGMLLAEANGRDDKREITDSWEAAGRRVVGPGFKVPRWGDRFNLDDGPQALGEFLEVLAVDRTTWTFRFPDPEPVIRWVRSLRDGWAERLDVATWEAIVAELRTNIALHIEDHGSFEVAKDSGVTVARRR